MKKLQINGSIEGVLAAFDTDEPANLVAKRFGISMDALRNLWKTHFGDVTYAARGKRIIAQASSRMRAKGDEKTCTFYQVPCSKCGIVTTVKLRKPPKRSFDKFLCDTCKYDQSCPVCGLLVDGGQGISMHFAHRRKDGDEAHITYEKEQEEAYWANQTPEQDYVTCLECGYRGKTLAMHFTAVHGYTAEVYKTKFGQDTQIRSINTDDAMSLAAKNRVDYGKGSRKIVNCSSCGEPWEGSKFLCPTIHDFRCEKCKTKEEALEEMLLWLDKSEPEDYVSCLECNYRAENLTSHIQNAHPGYRERNPGAMVVALNSIIRDVSHLLGIPMTEKTKQRIREVNSIGLTLDSFKPFIESDGTVDHRAMMKEVGCSWPTLIRYMDQFGLKNSHKYVTAAGDARRILFSREEIEPFKMKNGKIDLAKFQVAMGISGPTARKECIRNGLPTARGCVYQKRCLEALSKALDGLSYEEEWTDPRFVNPPTGRYFRYDGYFKAIDLVVEFQGYQHRQFPNRFLPNESYRPIWDQMCERDRIKRELIESSPNLIYFEVLEEEPFDNVDYLRKRLTLEGILPTKTR